MQSALDSPVFSFSHFFLPYHSRWLLQSYGYSVDKALNPLSFLSYSPPLIPFLFCHLFYLSSTSCVSLHRSSCDVYSDSWGFGFSKASWHVEPFIFNLSIFIYSLFTSFPSLSYNQHLLCRHKRPLLDHLHHSLFSSKSLFLWTQRQAAVIWQSVWDVLHQIASPLLLSLLGSCFSTWCN